MKILSWNIRGGLKEDAWNHLNILLKHHKHDITLLVETHLNDENSLTCIKKFGSSWPGTYVAGDVRAGGIVLVWKNGLMNIQMLYSCSQVINALVTPIRGSPWLLSGIYASNCPKERGCLWKFLSSIDTADLPWVLIGDFNCIDNQIDKRGGNQFKWGHSIGYFNELCSSSRLTEVKFQGGRFTWCNNRLGKKRILARLDKALVNREWWAKENISPLEKELKATKAELDELEKLDEQGSCSEADIIKMKCLSNKAI
ncbi:hypothetical protein Cni_G25800 [Canna indica]|uniref:Endonuclease/exonuclease/phosphatase domain-containing protein n=1 Tax=Canna indica TaxID=4628 RepID=A0AAQ3L503_9LILI|nr:hypothetical protein Cni_G25800 [Canna indica]